MKLSLAFALLSVLASVPLASAQGVAPTGSFGFLLNAYFTDSAPLDTSGTALMGVMNFDGAGNVAGTYTYQNGASLANNQPSQTQTGTFTGTYSSNPDGTGTITLMIDVGVTVAFAMVITDGGQALQLVTTAFPSSLVGPGIALQGRPSGVTGGLPMSLFLKGATGVVPLSLSFSRDTPLILTTSGAQQGTGAVSCGDGTAGTWTANVANLTAGLIFDGSPGGGGGGDFMLALSYSSSCGGGSGPQAQTMIGAVSESTAQDGTLNFVLQTPGAVFSGFARAAQAGGSLNGSYGCQFSNSPTPAATFGVLQFDGAGNVAVSLTFIGATAGSGDGNGQPVPASRNGTGTYSINPDGSGTITVGNSTFSFVLTDGGSQLLILRTDSRNNPAVTFGTARLQ
jgi:hypothetical protein